MLFSFICWNVIGIYPPNLLMLAIGFLSLHIVITMVMPPDSWNNNHIEFLTTKIYVTELCSPYLGKGGQKGRAIKHNLTSNLSSKLMCSTRVKCTKEVKLIYKFNKVSSGDQPHKYEVIIQHFRDCICLRNQGWCDDWTAFLYLYPRPALRDTMVRSEQHATWITYWKRPLRSG